MLLKCQLLFWSVDRHPHTHVSEMLPPQMEGILADPSPQTRLCPFLFTDLGRVVRNCLTFAEHLLHASCTSVHDLI